MIIYKQCCQWKFRRLKSNKEKKSVDSVWWYDSRYGSSWKVKSCSHWIVFKRERKHGISLVFISQSSFEVPKTIRLNTAHYFIFKTLNKRELQQIVLIHLSDIEFKDFMKIYKDYTKEPYKFVNDIFILVNDRTLS